MIFIDISKFTPSTTWSTKAQSLTAELKKLTTKKDRKDFIDDNKNHIWGELKKDLEKLSYGKCWYSESRDKFSYNHVDHFRPKKRCIDSFTKNSKGKNTEYDGYWWLTYDWKNYRICGGVGNTNKGDKFAVKSNKVISDSGALDDEMFYLLDPINKDDVKLITFNENGEAKPLNPDTTKWNHQRADYTIKTMKLDYYKLVEARREIWKETTDIINDITNKDNEYNTSPSATKKAELDGLKEKIRKYIAPCTELSATYRACLRASREDWALQLLEESIDVNKYCSGYISTT